MTVRRETPCSKCGGDNDRKPQRYCHACHAAYMRPWRQARTAELHELRRQAQRSSLPPVAPAEARAS